MEGAVQLNSTISDTLKSISDDKSLTMLNMIALSSGTMDSFAEKLNLTRRQCYSRITLLTNAGLIKRANRGYYLTSFGKIVYEIQILIGKAKQSLWKLNAIDSIDSSCLDLTVEERLKLVDSLVIDHELKELLNKNSDDEKEITEPLINKKTY